ncbi:MAG: S41 family peptidase [Desulfobacterales bacterium]|nr:S41 family peptidase [Desulfobacterales bacterium]
MKCRTKPWKKGVALAAVGIVLLGLMAALAGAGTKSPYSKLAIFARVLSKLEHLYVEPVDGDDLIVGAVRGMVRTLDPHSAFLLPDEFKTLDEDTKGRFGGVGVEVGIQDDVLTVITPMPGTPAEKAGLQPGDQVTAIEGEPTQAMNITDVVWKMRGEPGTEVTITVNREGIDNPFDVDLTREIIHIESVHGELLAPGYPWITVRIFQKDTASDVAKAMKRLTREGDGLKGVVLDLRRNPGGVLQEAVRLADLFVSSGDLVTTRGRGGDIIQKYKASKRATATTAPMVVLIDGASASAAEIVAGALQDHGRALLVGTRSFGKGSVQSIIDLGDGYGLKLTVARYFTPAGRSIQVEGVAPDVEIASRTAPEPDKETAALEALPGEGDLPGHLAAERTEQIAGEETLIEDYQLRVGFQLLGGLVRAAQAKSPDRK